MCKKYLSDVTYIEDGKLVGSKVGSADGSKLGVAVGFFVGALVVGFAVGALYICKHTNVKKSKECDLLITKSVKLKF